MATNREKKTLSSKEDKRHKKVDEVPIIVTEKPSELEHDHTFVQIEIISTPAPAETANEPAPEPTYDEPKLSEIIVKQFEGQQKRGLYEGLGEAMFSGGHRYKGEFSAGFMHGRGTYTWSDGIIYEGDFFQNQITGSGAYCWPNGSHYDGEVVNGLRHGHGSYTVKGGALSYTGMWYNGKREGKGRMNFDREKHSFYDGDWVDGIRQGFGIRQYPSGNLYQGMWYKNVRHGQGTMKWIDCNQMYMGQWEDGVQHGRGQLVWFLKRVPGSQYPLRNMYDGEFVKGIRNGYGAFDYADGAKYEGYWMNNLKHGKGKFTFKNGRIYEGIFENDHIKEYPLMHIDGSTTPEPGLIRTRTPLPMENMSVHSNRSQNTTGPSFQMELDELLQHLPECDREAEIRSVTCVVLRHLSALKKIYDFYGALGCDESPDNTYTLSRLQFWRLMKDCCFHHLSLSLVDMDGIVGSSKHAREENPYDQGILFREFLNHLVALGYHIYEETTEKKDGILAACFHRLVTENLLQHACKVQGYFYFEARRAINALVHVDQSYQVYRALCKPRKVKLSEGSIKMRQFLHLLKDLKLINNDLTAKAVIDILSCDDPNVADEQDGYNLELEMTFLEFFEALVGCAERYVTEAVVKDPTTPKPGTGILLGADRDATTSAGRSKASEDKSVKDDSHDEEDGGDAESRATHASQRTPSLVAGAHLQAGQSRPASSDQGATGTAAAADREKSAHDSKRLPSHGESNYAKETDAYSNKDMQSGVSCAGDVKSYLSYVTNDPDRANNTIMTPTGLPDIEATRTFTDHTQRTAEEELDPDTRKFNFWTHQIHIFFVRKFFPAFEKFATLQNLVKEKYEVDGLQQSNGMAASGHKANCICGKGSRKVVAG